LPVLWDYHTSPVLLPFCSEQQSKTTELAGVKVLLSFINKKIILLNFEKDYKL